MATEVDDREAAVAVWAQAITEAADQLRATVGHDAEPIQIQEALCLDLSTTIERLSGDRPWPHRPHTFDLSAIDRLAEANEVMTPAVCVSVDDRAPRPDVYVAGPAVAAGYVAYELYLIAALIVTSVVVQLQGDIDITATIAADATAPDVLSSAASVTQFATTMRVWCSCTAERKRPECPDVGRHVADRAACFALEQELDIGKTPEDECLYRCSPSG